MSLDGTSNQTYILNNTGVNIYNLNEEKSLTIQIENTDHIEGDIPILIKLGLGRDSIKTILNDDKSDLNYEQIGIFKFPDDKIIKMKFILKSNELITFNYYIGYLSSDYINDTSNIISPVLINNVKLNSTEHYFELKTELDLNRNKIRNLKETHNSNNKDESLYLIFSFDGKVEIITGNYNPPDDSAPPPPSSSSSSSKLKILLFCVIGLIFIGICICIFIFIKKHKRKKSKYEYETPKEQYLLGPYNKPTPLQPEEVTAGNEQKYELSNINSNPKIPVTTQGENNEINNGRISLDPEQPAPLPY